MNLKAFAAVCFMSAFAAIPALAVDIAPQAEMFRPQPPSADPAQTFRPYVPEIPHDTFYPMVPELPRAPDPVPAEIAPRVVEFYPQVPVLMTAPMPPSADIAPSAQTFYPQAPSAPVADTFRP